MFYDTFIIGLLQFLSPGSLLVSLILLMLLVVLGRSKALQSSVAWAYLTGVVLFYFLIIQNGYTYVRYALADHGIIDKGYLGCGGLFIAYGISMFIRWFQLLPKYANNQSTGSFKPLTLNSNAPRKVFPLIGVVVFSFVMGCLAAVLALDWVDSHQVLIYLVQSLLTQDLLIYFGIVSVYILMLMLPVVIVCLAVIYIRRSRWVGQIKFARYFYIINSALFLSTGLSYYLIK